MKRIEEPKVGEEPRQGFSRRGLLTGAMLGAAALMIVSCQGGDDDDDEGGDDDD